MKGIYIMDKLQAVLNLMSNDPDFYLKDMQNMEFRQYIKQRFQDLEPELKSEGIQLDMWSFRKFMSFIIFLERHNKFISPALFIDDDGNIDIMEIEPKFFYIKFTRDTIYYSDKYSDLLQTSGFYKLERFLKNLPE